MKYCSGCGKEKPLEEFHKHPHCADGRQSHCKDCQRAEQKERRACFGKCRRGGPRRHKCTAKCTRRFGFCIKARYQSRLDAFKKYGSPIMCKSGRQVPQASFAGR